MWPDEPAVRTFIDRPRDDLLAESDLVAGSETRNGICVQGGLEQRQIIDTVFTRQYRWDSWITHLNFPTLVNHMGIGEYLSRSADNETRTRRLARLASAAAR